MFVSFYITKNKEVIKIRYCCRNYNSKTINYNEMIHLANSQVITIIDVRSKQEYNEGHLDGAINIPLFDIKMDIKNHIADKNRIIVVYCDAGVRSLKAQKVLNMQGYKNVYNLEL